MGIGRGGVVLLAYVMLLGGSCFPGLESLLLLHAARATRAEGLGHQM